MTRYYFHVRSAAGLDHDPEGAEFEDIAAANREALQAAREMVAEMVLAGDKIDGNQFEITDEAGIVVSTVPFKAAVNFK